MRDPTIDAIMPELIQSYLAGESGRLLASRLGVSVATAYYRLRAEGVAIRAQGSGRRTPVDVRDRAVARYLLGEAPGDIAHDMGFGRSVVYGWVHSAGYATRPRGTQGRPRNV